VTGLWELPFSFRNLTSNHTFFLFRFFRPEEEITGPVQPVNSKYQLGHFGHPGTGWVHGVILERNQTDLLIKKLIPRICQLQSIFQPIFFNHHSCGSCCPGNFQALQYYPYRAAEILLVWLFAIELGIVGIWVFIAHTVFAAQVAESIGWAAGNPFQQEVAFTNLAIGVLGILSIRMKQQFRLSTIIPFSIFMIGAGIGHMYQLVFFNDTAINNAGPVL
jgi:hypothetical protein